MSDPIRPDFAHVSELVQEKFKKKRFPVASIAILVIVVAGVSVGGYYLHKKFRAGTTLHVSAPSVTGENFDYAATAPVVSATPSAPAERTLAPASDAPTEVGSSQLVADTFTTPAAPAVSVASPGGAKPEEKLAVASTSASDAGVHSSDVVIPPSAEPTRDAPATASQTQPFAPAADGAPENPAALLAEADRLMAQRNFQKAEQILKAVHTEDPQVLSAVLYRLGLVGRYSKNEKLAQDSWGRAYRSCPTALAGRMSALALADTWYYYYVESKPDFSQWEKVRDAYAVALGTDGARFMDDATNRRVGERLNALTAKLIFDPEMHCKGADFRAVRDGENLTSIAREYGVDFSSIIAINGINPRTLRVGQVLKIIPGRMLVVVDKKRFNLDFYLDGRFIKRYRCATGAPQTETPKGSYTVVKMDKEPTWTDPKTGQQYKYGEPGHLIGPRWMALKGMGTSGIGIHGTVDSNSMGKKISNGCIRLLNNDVEELYGFASVQPGRETEVLVIE